MSQQRPLFRQPARPSSYPKTIPIKPACQPVIEGHKDRFHDELVNSLKSAKTSQSANELTVDAIIAADDPVARNFPVGETLYDPQGEIGQPLEELNEQDMAADLEAPGISGDYRRNCRSSAVQY